VVVVQVKASSFTYFDLLRTFARFDRDRRTNKAKAAGSGSLFTSSGAAAQVHC
jgi:hypothetical protein